MPKVKTKITIRMQKFGSHTAFLLNHYYLPLEYANKLLSFDLKQNKYQIYVKSYPTFTKVPK